jgi:hypothetical protein
MAITFPSRARQLPGLSRDQSPHSRRERSDQAVAVTPRHLELILWDGLPPP